MLSTSLQILTNGLASGLLYALVALGFSLIYSATRIFDMAYGATYTASAYLMLVFISSLSSLFGIGTVVAFAASLLFTLAAAASFGLLFEFGVYRPLIKKNAPTLIGFISSLGIYIVMVNLIPLFFGNETQMLNPNLEPSFNIAGAIITRIQVFELAIPAVLIVSTLQVLRKTSLGRHIRALCDNPTLLTVLGTDTKKVRMLVFALASALAASASLLHGFDVGVDPTVGLSVVLTAAVAVIVGGVGSHYGAVFAAVFIGVAQNIVIWFTSAQWQHAVTFAILLAVLILRREGVFSPKFRLEEK